MVHQNVLIIVGSKCLYKCTRVRVQVMTCLYWIPRLLVAAPDYRLHSLLLYSSTSYYSTMSSPPEKRRKLQLRSIAVIPEDSALYEDISPAESPSEEAGLSEAAGPSEISLDFMTVELLRELFGEDLFTQIPLARLEIQVMRLHDTVQGIWENPRLQSQFFKLDQLRRAFLHGLSKSDRSQESVREHCRKLTEALDSWLGEIPSRITTCRVGNRGNRKSALLTFKKRRDRLTYRRALADFAARMTKETLLKLRDSLSMFFFVVNIDRY